MSARAEFSSAFNFDISPGIEKPAQFSNDLRARRKIPRARSFRNQIQIALRYLTSTSDRPCHFSGSGSRLY